jgi:hypothetical protein
MLSREAHLSLEPAFCKSTGAYRAEVARFCLIDQPVTTEFKLTRARAPKLLDSDCWPRFLPSGLKLELHPDVLVKENVRSTLDRKRTKVTVLIHSRNGFVVELDSPDLSQIQGSQAITLLRHGFLKTDEKLSSSVPTGLFVGENGVEVLKLEGRTLLRSLTSGRTVDLTGHSDLAGIIESKQPIEIDSASRAAFEQLCQLGFLRQITRHLEI